MKKEEELPSVPKSSSKETKTPWAAAHRAKIKSAEKSVKARTIQSK